MGEHWVKISGMKPMRIRDIRHENKNTLISVSGMILRKTEVKFQIIEAVFDCARCDHPTHIMEVGTGIFVRPFECENDICGRKGPFILNEDESTWETTETEESKKSPITSRMATRRWEVWTVLWSVMWLVRRLEVS